MARGRKKIEWTEEQIALIGTGKDRDVAEQLGVSDQTVAIKRREIGIAGKGKKRIEWSPEMLARIGIDSDTEIAKDAGISISAVTRKRAELGIATVQGKFVSAAMTERTKDALAGKKFGMLTVVSATEERSGTSILMLCRCDCGRETKIRTGALTSGAAQSCGCQRGRGSTKTRLESLRKVRELISASAMSVKEIMAATGYGSRRVKQILAGMMISGELKTETRYRLRTRIK